MRVCFWLACLQEIENASLSWHWQGLCTPMANVRRPSGVHSGRLVDGGRGHDTLHVDRRCAHAGTPLPGRRIRRVRSAACRLADRPVRPLARVCQPPRDGSVFLCLLESICFDGDDWRDQSITAATEMTSRSRSQMGYDSTFFARNDYQDYLNRLQHRSLEMLWSTSALNESIFAGLLFFGYGAPPTFNWDIMHDAQSEPIMDDPLIEDYNVEERLGDFVAYHLMHVSTVQILCNMYYIRVYYSSVQYLAIRTTATGTFWNALEGWNKYTVLVH